MKHKAERDKQKHEYYQNNQEVHYARYIKWKAKNRKRCNAYSCKWARNHRDSVNAYDRARRKDPAIRLSQAISSGIRRALYSVKNGYPWESLVGYTLDDLRKHLEDQFQPGMSWDNYGQWHIDHIIPVSLWCFEGPDDSEFKQCWALCNLQPLWAEENMKKNNRVAA